MPDSGSLSPFMRLARAHLNCIEDLALRGIAQRNRRHAALYRLRRADDHRRLLGLEAPGLSVAST